MKIIKGTVLKDIAIFNHQRKIVSWTKEEAKLPAKTFMIEGYCHIFEDKIDFKDLYKMYGYKPPEKLTKQNKYDILALTRDRHQEGTLNHTYWNYFCEKFMPSHLKNQIKLF
jgi:hypothetical protein